MIYSSLAKFDSTLEQDLGLTIQFKEDTDSLAKDVNEYAALVFASILDGYAQRHVMGVKQQRVMEAFKIADAKTVDDVATVLKIDLTIT